VGPLASTAHASIPGVPGGLPLTSGRPYAPQGPQWSPPELGCPARRRRPALPQARHQLSPAAPWTAPVGWTCCCVAPLLCCEGGQALTRLREPAPVLYHVT